jgi:hypothetical protein
MAKLLYPTDTKQVAITMTGEQIAKLARATYCLGMTRTEVLNRGLELFLEHYADAIQKVLENELEGGNPYEK